MSTRKRRPRRGNHTRARIWLVLIWIALRCIDAPYYLVIPEDHKTRMIGAILNDLVWSTVLLSAIGCRQNWARYFMVISLLSSFVFSFIALQGPVIVPVSSPILMTMVANGVVDLVVVIVLIFSPDIMRLTNRIYE